MVFITGLLIATRFWGYFYSRDDAYKSGLMNQFRIGFFLLLIALFFLILCWMGFLLVSLLRDKNRKSMKNSWLRVFLIIALLASLIFMNTHQPAAKNFLAGFKERMQSHADIYGIQQWLEKLPDGYDGGILHEKSDWPEAVNTLKPNFIIVSSKDRSRNVELWWGGGFVHWGLVVSTMNIDVKDRRDFLDDGFTLALTDESYVWVE